MESSDKKYGVAVALSGVFGLLGIHHFYLGRFFHGLVDLSLTLTGVYFLMGEQEILGWGILAVDYIHTVVVMIMLLVGAYKDSQGKIVTYPGQKIN
jgi:TM2 domain-containing membrane protein YozV